MELVEDAKATDIIEGIDRGIVKETVEEKSKAATSAKVVVA